MEQPPRVNLLIETSSSWGRDLIRGIFEYANQQGPWSMQLEFRGRSEALHLPANWQGDGVIARVTSEELADEIIKSRLPAVNVSWYSYGAPGIARCTNDEVMTGELLASHLLQRGFRSFAYCGSAPQERPGYLDRCGAAFEAAIAAAGHRLHRFPASQAEKWGNLHHDLAEWLKGLPGPLGVAVWGDRVGRDVTTACQLAGLDVPTEVAILSSEYDALMNSLSTPPLSTIDQQPELAGFQAAALLARLMRGEPPPQQPIFIAPLGVITRQSTDTTAAADPLVAGALEFIRDNFGAAIQVSHILKHLQVGRRGLERRFQTTLGRTVADELRRVRLEHAQRMLVDTRQPITAVASSSGFFHAEVFTRNFQRQFGMSPTEFRRRHRLR